MKISEQLQAARALIETPDKWTQGSFQDFRDDSRICASEAISRTGPWQGEAYQILSQAMGVEGLKVSDFNDSHTHEEVLAAFDRAIELAQKREA